jgi:octaprenyl-diphosphate synthase
MPELAHRRLTDAAMQAQPETRDALDRAWALVASDLGKTEARLAELLVSPIASIPQIGGHLTFSGGKRIRPLITLLAAQAGGYGGSERVTAAAVGELLHTATLLHDDVIDGGEFRRGRPAARLVFGNGLAVLTGDYCLARALQAMAQSGDLRAVRSMADMVTRMAEGEVAQLELAGDWSIDRERYYQVIDRKTAALISWCACVGDLLEPELARPLAAYGLELGYAFQIADDVLDYRSDSSRSGKTRAQDLREGKATLPLLIACERLEGLRDELRSSIGNAAPVDELGLHTIISKIEGVGALDEAQAIARTHAERAIENLTALPESPAKRSLEELATFVAEREA